MAHRRTERRERSSARRGLLALLILLPALVVGPVLGGGVLWVHAHGASGGHLHVAEPHAAHHDPDGLEARHDHHRKNGPDEHEEHAPRGLLIEVPQALAAFPRAAGQASAAVHSCAVPPHGWHRSLVESTHRPELRRSGWPPQEATRSGLVALLRSSHAILI